jgi:hypothetical protein
MTVARDELLETERERVTRQFEAGGSLGLLPAEKVERLSQLRQRCCEGRNATVNWSSMPDAALRCSYSPTPTWKWRQHDLVQRC